MPTIMFAESNRLNDSLIGRIDTPIRAVVKSQSDALTKKGSTMLDMMFNVEKSRKHAETVVYRDELNEFQGALEGGSAENDMTEDTFKSTIFHYEYKKKLTITAAMAEDANYKVTGDIRRRAEDFARAYYKTREHLGSAALTNGEKASMVFNKHTIPLLTCDGLPLFHKAHLYGGPKTNGQKTQSNFYYVALGTDNAINSGLLEEYVQQLAVNLRQMKDDNGLPLCYSANIIRIPGNRPTLERTVRKMVYTDRQGASDFNDVNTQAGYHLVVDPLWQATEDVLDLQSSEANRNLLGSMFYDRAGLKCSSGVDADTQNYFMTGRTRMSAGFCTYKHIMRLKIVANGQTVAAATAL